MTALGWQFWKELPFLSHILCPPSLLFSVTLAFESWPRRGMRNSPYPGREQLYPEIHFRLVFVSRASSHPSLCLELGFGKGLLEYPQISRCLVPATLLSCTDGVLGASLLCTFLMSCLAALLFNRVSCKQGHRKQEAAAKQLNERGQARGAQEMVLPSLLHLGHWLQLVSTGVCSAWAGLLHAAPTLGIGGSVARGCPFLMLQLTV